MKYKGDIVEAAAAHQRYRESLRSDVSGDMGPLFVATETPTMQDVERALLRLAENRGDYGITADDVIKVMREKGIAWKVDRSEQRRFSITGKVLKDLEKAGHLKSKRYQDGTPMTRKSERKGAHSNRQIIYVGAK